MYSRSSRSNASIEKPGSSAFMLRITRAVSFSSNHDATVDVTERSESTTGFSDSWYAPCSSANLRKIGFVSLSCCQRSWRGDEACKTSASPALRGTWLMTHSRSKRRYVLGVSDDARLDAPLFSRLGKAQLPPCPPRLLFLETGMLSSARIVESVDESLREGLVRRGITNGLCSSGNSRRDGCGRPRYLHRL